MKMRSLQLVYFSPTGTTKAVAQGIARGMKLPTVENIDITRPEARETSLRTSVDALLVTAVPVYIGRVPAPVKTWLSTIRGEDTPVVCVVVYGNRAYEDALIELRDIMTTCGCRPIACAAYIGEHSFSSPDTPIARYRPDSRDLLHAEGFGRMVAEKLQPLVSVHQIAEIEVPGCFPYRGDTTLWSVDFIAVDEKCGQCGSCAERCPVGAIDFDNSASIDQVRCITCCACIKHCPKNAKSMKNGLVKDVSVSLSGKCKERKEPEYYL